MKLKISKSKVYQDIDIVVLKDGVEVENVMSIGFTTKEIEANLFQGDKSLMCVAFIEQ